MQRTSDVLEPADHEARILAWRRARLARLTAPDSWLSLVGKYWLREGDNTLGSDAHCDVIVPHSADRPNKPLGELGVFALRDGLVRFTPTAGAEVLLRGPGELTASPIREPITLRTDLQGTPDRLLLGAVSCEVMQRDAGFAIRVRDPESAERTGFAGLDYFPIRHELRVISRFTPYDPPKPIDLAYETGATEHNVSPGSATFELDGQVCQVEPVLEGNGKRLLLVFSDPTNRDSSYGAGRFLYAPLPEGDRLVLDFNQAFNPPCAFTPYALCPLPPLQNRLAVRIEAGEKRPRTPAHDPNAAH